MFTSTELRVAFLSAAVVFAVIAGVLLIEMLQLMAKAGFNSGDIALLFGLSYTLVGGIFGLIIFAITGGVGFLPRAFFIADIVFVMGTLGAILMPALARP